MKPLLIALTMLTPAQDSTIEREQQELLNEQRNDVEQARRALEAEQGSQREQIKRELRQPSQMEMDSDNADLSLISPPGEEK